MIFAADVNMFAGIASAIFYGILIYVGGPKLVRALMSRQTRIVEDLSRADIARDEVATVRARYEAEKERVRVEAEEMLAEGKRDAEALHQQLVEQARAEIDRIRARTNREISLSKQTALVEIYRSAADRSFRRAEATLRAELVDDQQDRLIDEAMSSLEHRLLGAN